MNILAQKYRILSKKGEGTFSEVLKCQLKQDGSYWACKKMKQRYDSLEQVNNLREIQALRRLGSHPNVLRLEEVIFDKKSGTLVLVCELLEMNIYEMIRGKRHYLPEKKVKNYMYQLLKSIDFMHRKGIFHRDVKPENILVKEDLLKLADFGSCRSVYSKHPYTEYISTRWYRAPECLLTDGYYGYKMDIWSVGCVFFEVLSLHPLFPGSNEVDQIAKIHDILGTPSQTMLDKLKHKTRGIDFNFPVKQGRGIEKMLPHVGKHPVELIYKMCEYDPDERITAKQALRHPYFKELRDADKRAAALAKEQSHATAAAEAEGEADSSKIAADINAAEHDKPPTKSGGDKSSKPPPLHHHHKKKKKSLAKLQKESHAVPNEGGITPNPLILPKMKPTKLASSYSTATFPDNSFPKATFPKLHSTSMFPTLSEAFKKANKGPHKTIFGHYQLPSIEKKTGY
ncbi:MAPK/MAK/MRK overlapping kinase-like [Watersipora subatra]|uniref:MAPK/MAK/MRK overlapping kinase-like n=1 Tax=Watersipora subatra TaxID=2589382 RepID=UPI00355AF283